MEWLLKKTSQLLYGTPKCRVCKKAAPNQCTMYDATLCNRCIELHNKYGCGKDLHVFQGGTCQQPERGSSTCFPTCKTEFCIVCDDKHRVINEEPIVLEEESSSTLDKLAKLYPIAPLIGKKCCICSKRFGTNNACDACGQLMCDDCIPAHEASEHGSEDLIDATCQCIFCEHKKVRPWILLADANNTKLPRRIRTSPYTKNARVPQKPWANDTNIKADSLIIEWNRPHEMAKADRFQLGYTEVHDSIEWKIWPKPLSTNEATLDGLKSNTKYRFRVRVVHHGDEWPYSETSNDIVTKQSLAATIVQNGTLPVKSEGPPKVYLLPTKELLSERDQEAKIKKYQFGEKGHLEPPESEKTILLVGETGTGKTTLVEGIINYVTGVSFDDPYRFSIVQLEESEKAKLTMQTKSQTEWISCYTLHHKDGGRLDYTLTVIDTPGFGDTGGTDFDRKTKDQIRTLFTQTRNKGVPYLDAICFLSMAPDARLNLPQKYIVELMLSIFGKDVEENICSLITFSDGKTPPVIKHLEESGLKFKTHFRFNNSALFCMNDQEDNLFTKMFWDMGFKSFQTFFLSLKQMKRKDLAMTRQVLNERQTLENTLDAMHDKISVGISIVSELDAVVQNIEKLITESKQNDHYFYHVDVVQTRRKKCEPGIWALECNVCNETCHENCKCSTKKNIAKCVCMDKNACCMSCLQNCSAEKHTYKESILYHESEHEKRFCSEMRDKYRQAVEYITFEQIKQDKMAKLEIHRNEVFKQMQKVQRCQEQLNKIALRPNISSLEDYIDLLIAHEVDTPSDDHACRMKVLNMYKQKANPEKMNEEIME